MDEVIYSIQQQWDNKKTRMNLKIQIESCETSVLMRIAIIHEKVIHLEKENH